MTTLLPFIIAAGLLTLTPGLDTTLVLRTASIENKSKAFQTAFGIMFGCLAWGILIALGLGAFLSVSTWAYDILKWCGAVYLCWLAFNMIFRSTHQVAVSTESKTTTNWFMKGVMTNLLNPKVGVFYISFLPQFIPPTAHIATWTLGLVFIHALLGIVWFTVLIMMTTTMSHLFQRPQVAKWMDRITGGVLLFFAFKLMTSDKR